MSDPQPEYDSVPTWLGSMWADDLRAAVEGNQRALGIPVDCPEGGDPHGV